MTLIEKRDALLSDGFLTRVLEVFCEVEDGSITEVCVYEIEEGKE